MFSSESPQSIGLLGHDPNLRLQQEEACNTGDVHKLYNWLSEALANARHSDAFLTDTVNKALGLSSSGTCEELRQKCEYELNPALDKKDCEQHTCTKIENVHFKGAQSPLLEVDAASVQYPTLLSTSEVGIDHKLHLKDTNVAFWLSVFAFVYVNMSKSVGILQEVKVFVLEGDSKLFLLKKGKYGSNCFLYAFVLYI